ncbi:MAG: hypothetical protein PUK21_06440 [Peptostreptococcaceae bacterium]|nr:hypothetical protein [Peptostreptococcaceae bacterium]MDY5738737.1 hypothetical protein [Anaerovoracaceae bacterium]
MKKISILICICIISLFTITSYGFENTIVTANANDFKLLNKAGLNTKLIKDVSNSNRVAEYTFDYGTVKERVKIKEENGNIVYYATDGTISNKVVITKDNTIYLDGNEVVITTDETPSMDILKAGGWKSIYKGFSPYGSLTGASYSHYLSSGKQNIALGKFLDQMTASALLTVLGHAYPSWFGFTVDTTSKAISLIDTLKQVNPKTKYLGCKYATYTYGSADYKYICNYYANTSCTGSSKQVIIYEHFRVI